MPRRVNRIHATKQQLLALKFGETDRDTTMGHSPLIPQPQRSCSRQTGAIVFRHYDEGRNPFEPFDEPLAISTAKDEDHSDQSADPQPNGTSKHHPKPPRVDAKQITLKRIMARARAPPPTVLSARQAREEVNRETRKEFIRTHSALLKHSNIVESAKVDELVRTVMALNSIDAALENGSMPSSRSLLPSKSMRKSFMMPTGNLKALRSDDALANSTTAKSQPMSTRATKDADKYRFSLDTVKSLYREFEALNIDHVFLNCFSTGAPVLFGTNVVTLAQLKAASDVNLDIRFDTLLRIVRSDVPESYYATVMEQWKAYREDMKTSTTASFRDKFDLATVRDIERVWSILIDSLKDEPQYVTAQPPHDRGITIEQFVAYVENMRSLLTAEDAAALFEKHSVPGGLPASKHLGASPSLPPIASFAPGAGRARGIGRRPNKVVISDEVASEVNSPLLGAIKYQSFSGVSNASDDVQSTKGPSLMLITDARPVMTIQGFAMTVAQH